jgi:Xaa-Pro aminopeptidase
MSALSGRVEKVRAAVDAPLLVTKPVNVLWLTGLDSSNAALLVEPDRLRIFTDFRYLEKARSTAAEVVEIPRGLFSKLPELLPKRIAFESESLVHASWAALDAAGIETVPTAQLVEGIRAVKEPGELDAIRRAAAITNAMLDRLAEQPFVGRTEAELAWWIESTMHELGAEGAAFPPIVAAGPNGALPHANPGPRTIEEGETVVVDAAAKVDGYHSDCTRTFATGPLPDELARSYAVCLEGQLAGLEATRAGRSGREVDAVARDVIAGAGLGELFAHGLGHGVGMEIHEQPAMRPESEDVLAVDGVVTVEPGIYHPGLGGIRIEDLVIIGENEPEVLTTFTKELVTVGR